MRARFLPKTPPDTTRRAWLSQRLGQAASVLATLSAMTIELRWAWVAAGLCWSSAAVAQKAPPPRTPSLDRDFVTQLRAPGPLELRTKALLVAELARLERLLQATPKKSPDRPLLLRRLAEGYAELAAIAASEKALADEHVRRAKRFAPR